MNEKFHLAQGSSHTPVEKGGMRIYNMRFCPYGQRSLLVGTAKGIDFEVVNVNLVDKPDWFLALNPLGQVPTLEYSDGRILAESLIVSEYLDEIGDSTRPLQSKDPFQRSRDKMLMERFNMVINPLFKVMLNLHKPDLDLSPFDKMLDNLETFEKELVSRGTKFFGGDKPGLLDYMIWPWFERFEILFAMGNESKLKIPQSRFPRLFKWTNEMLEDEAVKTWWLPLDAHVQYLKARLFGPVDYDFLARQPQSNI
ncbi:pyrimidodiazepine synthase-like isoform X2 [Neocloeon triangulifer]|nr:pyrimidodiazepine synthase-like isoform X2 [Neocloeon triangulifer]